MKTLSKMLSLAAVLIAIGCQDPLTDSRSPEQNSKYLQFKDLTQMSQTSQMLDRQTVDELTHWQKEKDFVSLRSIYETSIQEEEKFLAEMVAKYGENSTLTRAELGYSAFTQKYLDKKVLVIDEYGLVDMNISIPELAHVVNADGIVKVGNSIVQYKRDVTKTITDGDDGKVALLDMTMATDQSRGIIVDNVSRIRRDLTGHVSSKGRMEANTSCDDVNNGYRLIAYEERVGSYQEDFCGYNHVINWFVRLRSLKKILGTWQNHSTNYLQVVSNNVQIGHYHVLDGEYPDMTNARTILIFANEVNVVHDLPYGHTEEHYYVRNYNWRCYGPGPEDRTLYYNVMYGAVTDITVKGKNSTQCDVGFKDGPAYPWVERPWPM
jgi:hypothetical protein